MYVYMFLNNEEEVIYVGKSKNLNNRLIQHFEYSKDIWKKEVEFIEIYEFEDGATMGIYEIYLIDKFKPKYNKNDKYLNTNSKLILPNINPKYKINVNHIKEHLDFKKQNLLNNNLFNKEDLSNRYIILLPKNKKFIISNKHCLENHDIDFLNKKIANIVKNIFKGHTRDSFAYTISYVNKNIIDSKILNDKKYLHYKSYSNAYVLFYLSDFNSENKGNILSEDCLFNVLNFMNINKTVDNNGNTYLYVATENVYLQLINYFGEKINIKFV